MFYTYALYNLYNKIYTNILSELNPISKSKFLNLHFKQNPVQSASAALQAERHLDFNPALFYGINLLGCAGQIQELRNLLNMNCLLQIFQNVETVPERCCVEVN